MIVEAQFLTQFILKAKKMGHKLYSIIRQSEYIESIANEIYNVDNNYESYKNKINKLISNMDTNNLVKQCFWRPNLVVSIINRYETKFGRVRFEPLLKIIGNRTRVMRTRSAGFKLFQWRT